jgi:catechol 2,3-dioxygenase-like lactoylglutathione lyase family enzyme
LPVKNLARSAAFYEKLGFRQAEGKPSEGWAVLGRDGVRMGLFRGYIKKNTLNFRGGNIRQIVRALEARHLRPTHVRFVGESGAGNASLKDPDGNLLFFDSTPSELRRRAAQRKRRR